MAHSRCSCVAFRQEQPVAPLHAPYVPPEPCGRSRHLAGQTCPTLRKTCHICEKANHFAPKCPGKSSKLRSPGSKIATAIKWTAASLRKQRWGAPASAMVKTHKTTAAPLSYLWEYKRQWDTHAFILQRQPRPKSRR